MERLKEAYSVAEFDKMSRDEFMIHLLIREANAEMAKIALKILERENPSIHMLVNKIKETEVAVWYNHNKEFGRMANMRAPKFCKPCDSKTHNESECWGPCEICGQRNHQSKYCRYKNAQPQPQVNPQPQRADKAAAKGKKNRKRRTGKKSNS